MNPSYTPPKPMTNKMKNALCIGLSVAAGTAFVAIVAASTSYLTQQKPHITNLIKQASEECTKSPLATGHAAACTAEIFNAAEFKSGIRGIPKGTQEIVAVIGSEEVKLSRLEGLFCDPTRGNYEYTLYVPDTLAR